MNNDNKSVQFNISHAIVSFVITAALYTVLLAFCEIVPFGDNTWISFDMKRQYVDFYAYYKSILFGDSNIFYSFDTALGSGLIGLCVYYLTSPFLLIIALFPIDKLPLAISLVIGLKLALSSFTFDLFLQKMCGKGAYICSVSFALCAFIMSNATNLMWLDVFIMLPILIIMTEKLVFDGKLLGYTLSVAAILYLNYYISYILLIFVLLWSIVRLWALKEKNPQEAILRLGIATGAGIGIDAVILLPTLIELRNSPKDLMLYGLKTKGHNLHPKEILTKLFSLSYDSLEVYWGYPLIFCGVIILLLAVMYFFNKKIGVREKISIAVLYLILTISFIYDDINLLWHAGMEPSGYPYREAILFVFLMLLCACRSLQEYREGYTITRIAAAFAIVGIIALYVFIRPIRLLEPWKIYINIALIIVGMIHLIALYRFKSRVTIAALSMLLIVLQVADIGINSVYIYNMESLMSEGASEFAHKVNSTDQTVDYIKGMDNSFYRTESWTPRQQNDAMMYDYKGITHYSSAGLTYVRRFLQNLGYNDDGLYTDFGHDNTQTADSILGIKYLMTDRAHGYRMHKDYELVKDGEIQVYNNPYALPAAVGVFREMSGESSNPFQLQEEIYGRLSGEPVDIFIPANVEYGGDENGGPLREYRVIAEADGEMYFYMSDLVGSRSNLEVYYNNEFLTYYGNDSCLKVLNLGYYKKGDYFIVHVKADDSGQFGEALFVTEDTDALKKAYDMTTSRHAHITSISASRLAMTLDSEYTVGDDISGEVGVFTTIPYQKGWKVKVCGIKVEPVEVYDSLMYIPLTDALQQAELGPNENIRIELYFIPEGFYIGAVISILAIGVIALMGSIRRGEADFFDEIEEDAEESDGPIFPSEAQ
ncbi:MAG: YfhO family protein [Lachnospiraceae bacterium]|nr:YfhO family protein [Lachnospiraceae bacterium]